MCQLHPKEHWPELILLLIRSERILIPTASKRILIRTATLQNAPTDPKGILIKTTSTTATTARKNTDPNCLQKNARPNSYSAKWDGTTAPKRILTRTTSTTATTTRKNTDPNCVQKNIDPNCYFAKWANCIRKSTGPNCNYCYYDPKGY